MPHPDLLKWKAKKAGMIAVAYDTRKEYHLITDFEGRDSLYRLIALFDKIVYRSSIDVVLDRPSLATVDAAVRAHFHGWASNLKFAGGAGADSFKLSIDREFSTNLALAAFQAILKNRNYGHSEYHFDSGVPIWIW